MDPKMFQNLETNTPKTHAKFELDWFSGFIKNGYKEHTDFWIHYQDYTVKDFIGLH